ncbi:MAG: hypothetical protein HOV71_29125 [Hamadaea sp.]|nr:hypothetical protein [Hamadaea sp.]NUR52205.1 hypothetical protein [Hamadaea sp.]NUT02401.1 hypothetical protein [Hamadaea sp.]
MVVPPARPRKLAKVPFVELAEGRLQGVVSSGSDIERVYVSQFTAGDHTFSCSTNNNRPCGGLYGDDYTCKHLDLLMDEAVVQFGGERIARYLRIDAEGEIQHGGDLIRRTTWKLERSSAAGVFARFLRHLSYLELPGTAEPLPELQWFPATQLPSAKAVR